MTTHRSRLPFTARPLMVWAARIGHCVADKGRFRDQERDDIVSAGQLRALKLFRRKTCDGGFDFEKLPPGGEPFAAWCGWAHMSVWKECVREAERLRGGGMFRTARPENVVIVQNLASVDFLPDETVPEPADREPPTLNDTEPTGVPYGRRLALGRGKR